MTWAQSAEVVGWVILGFFVLFIIGLPVGSIIGRRLKRNQPPEPKHRQPP